VANAVLAARANDGANATPPVFSRGLVQASTS